MASSYEQNGFVYAPLCDRTIYVMRMRHPDSSLLDGGNGQGLWLNPARMREYLINRACFSRN